ncbi:hypothetical protein [Streptomyces sp. NPDC093600]|uniref:hypothetical protein n=1 Tax=Streptomyces sp. NPDC093600 TaxID=3366047 RepID=UPI00381DD155
MFADRLFTAWEQGTTEQQQIVVEGLAETYFSANHARAHGLGVEFTDVEHTGLPAADGQRGVPDPGRPQGLDEAATRRRSCRPS